MKPGLEERSPERELPAGKDFVRYIPSVGHSCCHWETPYRCVTNKGASWVGMRRKKLCQAFDQLLDRANISIGVGGKRKGGNE